MPFRSWCPWCVKGGQPNDPHKRIQRTGETEIPEVMMDYAFVRKGDEERPCTILITKDRDTRVII